MQSVIKSARRLIVKVGSSLVTNNGQGIDQRAIDGWVAQIASLRQMGKEIVLVSSGAIAQGMSRLCWTVRPTQIHELQAAAAVGQMGLAQIYQNSFNGYGLCAAQILLTHADFADRERYLNARSTLQTLLHLGAIPIINENDTVATDEIKFGDNDTLAALVSNLIDADALIILTDQAGVLTADPRYDPEATLIPEAQAGDLELEKIAGGGGPLGRGGMLTKILAAKRAAQLGAHTVIACGREDKVLERLAVGECIGTQLLAATAVLSARKQWIANHLQMRGHVVIDMGAQYKLVSEGKSLLPIGVAEVHGEFTRGDVIACLSVEGQEIARGISNYSAAEARLIARHASSEIEKILGYISEPELINRDNLVIIA